MQTVLSGDNLHEMSNPVFLKKKKKKRKEKYFCMSSAEKGYQECYAIKRLLPCNKQATVLSLKFRTI